jgi:hypothetical protein
MDYIQAEKTQFQNLPLRCLRLPLDFGILSAAKHKLTETSRPQRHTDNNKACDSIRLEEALQLNTAKTKTPPLATRLVRHYTRSAIRSILGPGTLSGSWGVVIGPTADKYDHMKSVIV